MLDSQTLIDQANPGDVYVSQRRIRGGKVVCASHPILGTFYWQFISNADCNAPDYLGLTTEISSALRLAGDWRDHDRFNHPCKFASADDIYPIAKGHGVTRAQVRQWLSDAKWESVPAPGKLYWFAGMEGFWGDSPEWTDDLSQAATFTAAQVANGPLDAGDIDFEVASRQGHFVRRVDAQALAEALFNALPRRPDLTHEIAEENPFTITVTGYEDIPDEYGFRVHFTVSGATPTDDAMEEWFEWMYGTGEDHNDEPYGFGLCFDPLIGRGTWETSTLEKAACEVGKTYTRTTGTRLD